MPENNRAFEAHAQRTKRVASQVRSFYDRKQPFRIFHGSTSSTRSQEQDRNKMISTSDFTEILKIDAEKRVAVVEPNVSMEKLVDATLPYGLVAPVIMEFKNITVGGGFSGTSGESSSFRHGVFDNIVNSIEIVLGDGDIVHASRTEKSDLFHGAAGSFGTLGVVTKIEVQLVEAGNFMELEYRAISGGPEAVKTIEAYTADNNIQYLDGIMFSKTSGVIIAGRMTSNPPLSRKISKYLSRSDPWFYVRAQEILNKEIPGSNGKSYTEYVPIKDYLFRFDRGAFWGGYHAFKYHFAPFNNLTRYLLDDLIHTKTMYTALHKSGLASEFIVQDIGFPYSTTPDFIDYLDDNFNLYPLWLCPLKLNSPYPLTPKGEHYQQENQRVINIGVWGPGPRNRDDFIAANRAIEAKTKELDGLKCLYAHAYYTAPEFWDLYDKEAHDSLREKYNATLLPSVFDKVTNNGPPPANTIFERLKNVRPVRGIYGALCVFWGGGLPFARVHQGLSIVLSPLLLLIFISAWTVSFGKDLLGLRSKRQRKAHVE
ncbi:FAD-binding domain-containing protein [Aureobasidium pullulans]|uniref:Delta(24)-sterol reductase n=1 Tax=Aureobasidium pullulans TaxID=5580 RepID=A0A4S8SYD7_AURPU|nr:FAD-binding domain-containing protein [Aureobasidium pullulans]